MYCIKTISRTMILFLFNLSCGFFQGSNSDRFMEGIINGVNNLRVNAKGLCNYKLIHCVRPVRGHSSVSFLRAAASANAS